jgi:two-component system, OmpR family, phosphate regulon sensor histidine kinase PhoR
MKKRSTISLTPRFISSFFVLVLLLFLALPFLAFSVTGSSRGAFFFFLLLVSAAGLLLTSWFFRGLRSRIQQLTELSRLVADGPLTPERLSAIPEDAFGGLEQALRETNRRIQEKIGAIATEKEKLESTFRCMTEGVLVVDTQGTVMLLNGNAERMFNLPAHPSSNGRSLMEVSRHPEMKKLMQEVLSYNFSVEPFAREISLNDGKWFGVNAVTLRDGTNQLLGHVLVFHDVTELKHLETVRADFVANVSHELRTPLSAIKGYVETLLHNPPKAPETAHQFLQVVDRHSERLGRLIDDLLTLSDLESGKAQLAQEDVAVEHLFRRVLEIFHDQAKKKGISIAHEVDPDLPLISGDPDRLQQLLINLVDNALKYTPSKGRVQVRAQLSGSPNGNQLPMVEIAVSDTGCGIPEKDIPRLTERFYRVEKARSRELGGTGLGLAIVKHIVQAHNGYLKIESQVQKGTTVRVFLPSAKSRQEHKEIIFLCTANSCRSQMAEGLARAIVPKRIEVFSAGTNPTRVNPLAVQVMKEIGIDISAQQSKSLDEVPLDSADLVVTLCGEAAESCPTLSRPVEHLHWPIPDPALAQGDEEYVLQMFRQVRDEIRTQVQKLLSLLPVKSRPFF